MNNSTLIEIGSIVIAIIAIYISQKNFEKTLERNAQKEAEIMSNRVTAIEVKLEVFWSGMLRDAAITLHQPDPTHAERDDLLEKLLAKNISNEEILHLKAILEETIGTTESEGNYGEKMAASILLHLIESTLVSGLGNI